MKNYFFFILLLSLSCFAISKNGFILDNSSLSEDQILKGGPPKDGIPALFFPKFINAHQALFEIFDDSEKAIIVKKGNVTKAYPLAILNWHEIVNDKIDNIEFTVTYCPLCGTGIVFYAPQKNVTFGVSGLLYQSDVLLYDHKTNSLWSQILQEAVTGKLKGTKLKFINSKIVNLKKYIRKHPDVLTMSKQTKFSDFRNYTKNPYEQYETSRNIYFPIKNIDSRYHPKMWTIYINYKGIERLIAFDEFKGPQGIYKLKIDKNKIVKIIYNKRDRLLHCQMDPEVDCITGFWFALRTFFPFSEIVNLH